MNFLPCAQQLARSLRAAAFCLAAFTSVSTFTPAAIAANASDWRPERNVELVVGTAPGGGSDATARLMQHLFQDKKLIERPAIVVNKPGGGGAVAAAYMAQNAGNAHELLVVSPTLLTNFIMGKTKVNYTDLTPLAQIGTEYVTFAVPPESPIKSGADLVARLKKDPNGVSFALANSLGNHNHIAIAQLAGAVGADVKKMRVTVFNSSSEATSMALGAHVDVLVAPGAATIPHMQNGKLRVIAVAAPERQTGALASVPTWREQGMPVVSSNWRSVVGPRGMTPEQIQFWDGVFARLVQQDEWRRDMAANHFANTYLNAADTRKLMDAQFVELTNTLRTLGLAK
jgi:putative tricarboxylic transport membrane protein